MKATITKTMESLILLFSQFNQILTMGQWVGVLELKIVQRDVENDLKTLSFNAIEISGSTRSNGAYAVVWKTFSRRRSSIEINTVIEPKLYRYYLKGNWDVY